VVGSGYRIDPAALVVVDEVGGPAPE
jgi:hypothetical protein